MPSTRRPALLGIAHGSRNPDSATVTQALVIAAGSLAGADARTAYLEDFAAPSIDDAVRKLAADGQTDVIAVPLLFTQAYHATEDAPAALGQAAARYDVTITMADVLGTGEDLATALASHVSAHDSGICPDDDRPLMLLGVGSSRPGANDAVINLGTALAHRTGRAVVTRFATCAPRARDFFTDRSRDTGAGSVVPLFTAPGLLLDSTAAHAREAGWTTLPHLGESLALLVATRYMAALESR